MKRDPTEQRIRRLMSPGILSRNGFLGLDERSLADIAVNDLAVLEHAGVCAEDIALLLDELHQAADAALETQRTLFDGRVTVQAREGQGLIPCPFGCGAKAHKGTVTVTMAEATLVFTPLYSHLVREHGFFQARGARFRLDPHALIALYRLCRG